MLEAGRVDAAVHAGAQRAALEAMAAECGGIETGTPGATWTMRAIVPVSWWHGRRGAGGIAAVAAAWRGPDPAERRAFGDARFILPAAQRAAEAYQQ